MDKQYLNDHQLRRITDEDSIYSIVLTTNMGSYKSKHLHTHMHMKKKSK
jgi:hypothetical protein